LRTKMRKVFSKTPFETVVIQGNHDVDSFQPGTNFGDNFTVLSDPFKPIEREQDSATVSFRALNQVVQGRRD
jgi:hypothetical protein